MCKKLLALLYMAGLLVTATTAEAVQYTAVDLGTMGRTNGEARAINDNGQVVGCAFDSSIFDGHAFLWQNGVVTDLGTLGGNYSFANAINNNGQVVGYSSTPLGKEHAFMWQNGAMTDLGVLPGCVSSRALAVNNVGQVVGWSLTSASIYHGFIWQNGQMTDLGGGTRAFGINDNGQIAGQAQSHACLWQNGTATDLGTLGGTSSAAKTVNGSGQLAGSSFRTDRSQHAVLWQNGSMTDLGTLGGADSWASLISDGMQIVGDSRIASGRIRGYVWQNGSMTGLDPLPGYADSEAWGINKAGQIIGSSLAPHYRVVLWQPVPEPTSVLSLLCGFGGLITVAYRRGR